MNARLVIFLAVQHSPDYFYVQAETAKIELIK
jgi:hypothetical protein